MNEFPLWLSWLFQFRLPDQTKFGEDYISFGVPLDLFDIGARAHEEMEVFIEYYPPKNELTLNLWNNGRGLLDELKRKPDLVPCSYAAFTASLKTLCDLADTHWSEKHE